MVHGGCEADGVEEQKHGENAEEGDGDPQRVRPGPGDIDHLERVQSGLHNAAGFRCVLPQKVIAIESACLSGLAGLS